MKGYFLFSIHGDDHANHANTTDKLERAYAGIYASASVNVCN